MHRKTGLLTMIAILSLALVWDCSDDDDGGPATPNPTPGRFG